MQYFISNFFEKRVVTLLKSFVRHPFFILLLKYGPQVFITDRIKKIFLFIIKSIYTGVGHVDG